MLLPSVPSPDPSPARNYQSQESQEEFDLLFDSVAEEQVPSLKEEGPPPLSDNDLAVFDPCYKQGENKCKKETYKKMYYISDFVLNDCISFNSKWLISHVVYMFTYITT